MNYKIKHVIKIILLIFFGTSFIIGTIMSFKTILENNKANMAYDDIRLKAQANSETDISSDKRWLKTMDFDALKKINNEIVGFINVDVSDDAQYNDCGELYALYLINDYKGQGYGRKLFAMAIKELKNMGFTKMIVGCLAANPTNEFYKHMGGKLIKQRVFEKLKLPENVYLFEKI